MKGPVFPRIVVLLLLCGRAFPQQAPSPLSVLIKPGVSIPIGADAQVYDTGGGGSLTLTYDLIPYLQLGLNAGYDYLPVDTLPAFPPRGLSITHLGLQAASGLEPLANLRVSVHAGGGYYYGLTNEDPSQNASNPYLYAGAGLSYRLIPAFSLGVEGSYRNFLGLAQELTVNLAGALHIGGNKGGSLGKPPNRQLDLLDVSLQNVFPVFYGHYDTNPLGVAVLRNKGGQAVENVRVFFHVRQYMDSPKQCAQIEQLGAGEQRQIPLYALFTDGVLQITEGTKVSASLIVESEIKGESFANEFAATLRLYDRNAMTWDVTAKAAAFVTAKDPTVLRFSKNVSGLVKDHVGPALAGNLALALALFQALDVYGLRYEVDPSSAYTEFSQNAMMVDYLQFPRQTLEFRAGDCDDLSILFSALLESVGIETAFITIPGHIFLAFSSGMSFEEAGQFFNSPEDVINVEGTAWLPVEITAIREGFVRAWKTGAGEWRANKEKGQNELVPVHKAWASYDAVGYAGQGAPEISIPAQQGLLDGFLGELDRFVQTEIYSREQKLNEEVKRSGGSARSINKLGILYARFGQTDRARAEFQRALAAQEYLPALVNLGMLALLDGDSQAALDSFRRARRLTQQDQPSVLLGLARAYHELGDYAESARAFTLLKALEPKLAQQYAYLDLEGSGGAARAAEASGARTQARWEEEP